MNKRSNNYMNIVMMCFRDRTDYGQEQVLNQLLTELDGMNERKDVIMLASTNRADMLDRVLFYIHLNHASTQV